MSEVWPVTLPRCFLADTVDGRFADNAIHTQTDTGPGKDRRRSTANIEPLSGQMLMTRDQFADSKTFYDTTTLSGSVEFTFPDPLGGSDLLVKFSEPPDWHKPGVRIMVNLKLAILP